MRAAEIGQTELYSLQCLETNKKIIKFSLKEIGKLYDIDGYNTYYARHTSNINFIH